MTFNGFRRLLPLEALVAWNLKYFCYINAQCSGEVLSNTWLVDAYILTEYVIKLLPCPLSRLHALHKQTQDIFTSKLQCWSFTHPLMSDKKIRFPLNTFSIQSIKNLWLLPSNTYFYKLFFSDKLINQR